MHQGMHEAAYNTYILIVNTVLGSGDDKDDAPGVKVVNSLCLICGA